MAIIDKDYFLPLGILKLLQAVFGTVTMSLIASGRTVEHTVEFYFTKIRTIRPEMRHWGFIDNDYRDALIFALLATVVVLAITLVLFFSFLFKVYDQILLKQTWRIIDFGFSCLATLLYFVLFIVLAVYCAHPKQSRMTNNGPLVGACVLSLFITALYALAAYKMADILRRAAEATSANNSPTTKI